MPKVYGYLRVSHKDQSDNTFDTQSRVIEDRFRRLVEDEPDMTWGEMFMDKAVSAYRKGFFHRPAAASLNARLQRGDVAIFARSDRGFRNLLDMLKTVEHWKSRGVRFIFCDLPAEPGTPMGDMFMAMLGAFAQWDSSVKSERIKAGIATRRAKGVPLGRKPHGFNRAWSYTKGHKVQFMLPETEKVGRKIVELRDSGMGFVRISDEVEDIVARLECRKSHRGIRSRYKFSKEACQGLYERFCGQKIDSPIS